LNDEVRAPCFIMGSTSIHYQC